MFFDVIALEVSPEGFSHCRLLSTRQIGILRGYLESQGPVKTGKMTTHNTALCAVLYSKIFKQVSGQGWPQLLEGVTVTVS